MTCDKCRRFRRNIKKLPAPAQMRRPELFAKYRQLCPECLAKIKDEGTRVKK